MFYLFLQSGCRHPSLDVGCLFLSQKEWHSSTLWRVLYLSLRENLQSSIVWAILSIVSSIMFISIKNWFMRSFRGTIVFTAIHLSKALHIFLTLDFAAIQFYQRIIVCFIVFQNTRHRKTNLLSKKLYFQCSIDYFETSAATWSSYFFSRRFFLKIYLSETATSV